MLKKDFLFTDLVHSRSWQSIQDSLAEALGFSLRTFSPDRDLLIKPSRPASLCDGMLHKSYNGKDICGICQDASVVGKITKITNLKGPFGLDSFVIPIKAVGDRVIANIFIGPVVLNSRRKPLEYDREAASFGINPEELQDALIDINVFSYSSIDVMIKLVSEVFSYIAQSGYHKKRLGEIAPEIEKLDPLFSSHYEERILGNLLSCCSLAINADSGSVMIVDRKTKKLHIKVAERIDQRIVDSTEIGMGEGIAGLAAEKSQSFILPHDQNKNHLSDKMSRHNIKSSMIVPFNKGNESDVYGVINLNLVKKEIGFTEREVALVKEMVNMASIALIPVQAQ